MRGTAINNTAASGRVSSRAVTAWRAARRSGIFKRAMQVAVPNRPANSHRPMNMPWLSSTVAPIRNTMAVSSICQSRNTRLS